MAQVKLDDKDKHILQLLQQDTTLSVAHIAKEVGLSTTPCWRRIQRFEDDGILQKRVALLDPEKIGASVTVFMSIRASEHSEQWLKQFSHIIKNMPQVVEFYRMSGTIDYLLKVIVPDIKAYDKFYKDLVSQIDLKDVSSTFAMEEIKYITALPIA